ncbi:TonB-dependent receptor domain-containing protein [Agarilytica rhodophyticola]|uniref:TonB-dependent receptor domain-containing protein n=1 Tax=Agarilytica rhodophyticola TaxID=1737490 RepID=UPI001319F787|nr:TonB-dependent receptor [Agarilytica rhodophyticola]
MQLKNQQLHQPFCKTLLAIAVASFMPNAFAQDVDFTLEQIEITGTRILGTDNDVSVQPVTVLDGDYLRASGRLTAGDILNELPMFGDGQPGGSSINSLNGGFSADARTINLRNLGDNRSLVLVNGRRHVGGDVGTSSVDLNSIPVGLIERVEILTGGASAVYGADAVTGVVNVILKTDFVGNEFTIRGGASGEDDAEETALSFTHGGEFKSGGYQFSLEYSDQQPVFGRDRDFAQFDGSAATGLSAAANGSGVTPQGSYISADLGNGRFDTDGSYVPGLALERFQRAPTRSLLNETERFLISGRVDFQVSDSSEFFIEGTYNNTETEIQFDPQLAIFSDAGFASSGTAGFRFPTAPTVNVDGVNTTNNLGGNLRVSNRRLDEYGPRRAQVERELTRFVFGLEGNIGNANYELFYQYGQVDATQTDFDTIDKQRFITAINPQECAATSGCVFADIYGRGTIDRASLAYVADDLESDSESTQHVFGGYVTGDAFKIGGRNAAYVIGFEYRDESATIEPNSGLLAVTDPETGSGNLVGLKGTRTFFGTTDSSYDVSEVFGELKLPLTALFDVGVSARFSDYSSVGSEFTAGLTADLAVNEYLRFRSSVGSATRAPNILELASPDASITSGIADPCDTLADDGSALTPSANCSQLVAANYNPSDLDQQIRSVTGGNENLDSETAITATLGAVLTFNSTVISLDYYQISMEDVLADAFSPQATLNRCVDTLDPFFCNNITRDSTSGFITSIRSEQTNLAEEDVSGIELSFNHAWILGEGELEWSGVYTHLLEHTRKVNDLAQEQDLAGRVDNIENRINTTLQLTQSNWYIGMTVRHLDDAVQSIDADPTIALGNDIDAVTYLDLFAGYQATPKLLISAGVENVTDEESPIVTQLYENNGSADTTAPGIYDVRGLFGYVQASYKF